MVARYLATTYRILFFDALKIFKVVPVNYLSNTQQIINVILTLLHKHVKKCIKSIKFFYYKINTKLLYFISIAFILLSN